MHTLTAQNRAVRWEKAFISARFAWGTGSVARGKRVTAGGAERDPGGNIDSNMIALSHPGRASALREVGALSDLDNVAVRIADAAANLAVLFLRLRYELGSSIFP